MTSICPETSPSLWQRLQAEIDELTSPWQILAPQGSRLALLNLGLLQPLLLSEAGQPGIHDLLSPAEQECFQQFCAHKRRLEWLGGRLAAKHCVQSLAGEGDSPPLHPDNAYSILADTSGRPCLLEPEGKKPAALSISHSHGFAAALACRSGSCGIDIQQITAKLASVQERFTTREELDLVDPLLPLLSRLGLIWTAKEAVKKCLLADHSSFFGAIGLIDARCQPGTSLWAVRCQLASPHVRRISLQAAEMGDYWLACCTSEDHA